MRRPTALSYTLLVGALLAGPATAGAQSPSSDGEAITRPVAPVPFGPGERLEYKVKLGPFSVGEGAMEVSGIERVHGHPTYHLTFDIGGRFLFASVEDTLQSWMDVHTLTSRRFEQDQKEVSYERHRTFEFFPEEGRWERADEDEEGTLPTLLPLDEVSFVYFVRTLPLEPGDRYEFHRYFQEDGNPVVLEVLRREIVEVPAGTFHTVVVRPIIQTSGLFSQGGKAEVYFSDDPRRLVVQLKSSVPIIGSLSLHLKRIQPADPLESLPADGDPGRTP